MSVPFQYDPANHRNAVSSIILSNARLAARNQAQRDLLNAIDPRLEFLVGDGILNVSLPCATKYTLYDLDAETRGIRSFDEQPIFRNVIYLVNVIVAIEWNPSPRYLQQIRNALKQASDFLFDTTNGYAAIGQVVIGGPELMPAADIQIMASNRLHPRAWVDALNERAKFKPIRVGRGLWQKNEGLLLPWDSPEGYRALVHEWGHYAFGLADEYLSPFTLARITAADLLWKKIPTASLGDSALELRIVAPTIALSVNTLMASTQISEFIEWPTIITKLRQVFTEIVIDPSPLDGPNRLPLPLPEYTVLNAHDYARGVAIDPDAANEYYLPIAAALDAAQGNGAQQRADQSHWLYLLKPLNGNPLPQQIIAQGKTGNRDRQLGFLLYGARDGDVVVLISQVGNTVKVQRTTVWLFPADGQRQILPQAWQDVTPTDIDKAFFVDVIPKPFSSAPSMQADIAVRVEKTGQKPDQIQIYPAGAASTEPLDWAVGQVGVLSVERTVPHLDGHVLLRWVNTANGKEGLFIASYSQGGGPDTSGGGRLPITAGSADGNAMVFFRENDPPLSQQPNKQADQGLRIVTTTITVGQQQLSNGAEARSYVFSLASNNNLSPFPATLVLYYDREATKRGGDLLIHRWNPATREWMALATYSPLLPYVAIPLIDVAETAPALMQNPPAMERYRIFWTPATTPTG
jgi:hypothetical protein